MHRSRLRAYLPAPAALGTLCIAAAAPAITFSVDFQSPTSAGGLPDSFTGTAIGPADLLTVVSSPAVVTGPNPPAPSPLQLPGTEIGGPPGAPGLVPGGLGIGPGAAGNPPELDALSYGRDDGTQLAFSVDEFAAVAFPAGAPALAIPAATLGLDLLGAGSDDLDALVFDDADGSLGYSPGDTVYFSVRRGSAVIGSPDSAFGVPIEEGDVLGPPAVAGGFPALFVPAESLGLATSRTDGVAIGDELDALDLPEPGALLQLAAGGLLIAGLARRRPR